MAWLVSYFFALEGIVAFTVLVREEAVTVSAGSGSPGREAGVSKGGPVSSGLICAYHRDRSWPSKPRGLKGLRLSRSVQAALRRLMRSILKVLSKTLYYNLSSAEVPVTCPFGQVPTSPYSGCHRYYYFPEASRWPCQSSRRGRYGPPSHTTVRAVRHTAVPIESTASMQIQ